MTSVKKYFTEIMAELSDNNENGLKSKQDSSILINNTDTGNSMRIEFDPKDRLMWNHLFNAIFLLLLDETPETNEGEDPNTTEVFLDSEQIERLIDGLEQKFNRIPPIDGLIDLLEDSLHND